MQLVPLNSVCLAKAEEYYLAHHKYKGNYKIILHDHMTQRANVCKSHGETQGDEKLFRLSTELFTDCSDKAVLNFALCQIAVLLTNSSRVALFLRK